MGSLCGFFLLVDETNEFFHFNDFMSPTLLSSISFYQPPFPSPSSLSFLDPPPSPRTGFDCAASCLFSSSGTLEMELLLRICLRSYMVSASSGPRNVMATPLLPARPVRPIRCV